MRKITTREWLMAWIIAFLLGILYGAIGCTTYNASNDEQLQHIKDSLSQSGNNYIDSIISLYTPGKDSIIYLEKKLPEGMKLVEEKIWTAMINNCTDISLELERILNQGDINSAETKKYLEMIHSLNDEIWNLEKQDSINNANKPNVVIKPTPVPKFEFKTFLGIIGAVIAGLIVLDVIRHIAKKVKK